MGQPEPGDGIVKPDLALLCWNPALPERQVPAYRQVRKQMRLLEHIGQGPLMNRPEQGVCLPGRAEDGKLSLGLLQPGDTPEQRGLAASGVTKQRGNSVARQFQVDIQFKSGEPADKARLDGCGRHRSAPARALPLRAYRVTRTRKENTTMPAASQWAWVYSRDST